MPFSKFPDRICACNSSVIKHLLAVEFIHFKRLKNVETFYFI